MDQPRWLDFAWADLGLAEAPGLADNPKVVRYFAEVGHAAVTDDETAWCAAFLGACLERAGTRSSRSLMARSYLAWGQALGEPRTGAIAILSRGFDPRLGHVGFLVGQTPADVILLGGNQGDAVTVQRFPRSRLLGLRWPSMEPATPPPSPAAPTPPASPGEVFERALAHVLEMEGGYDDDPYDPGGPTNFGITIADFVRDLGIELTAGNISELKAQLQAIPSATVRRIYLDRYWRPAACPDLPPAIAVFHFDTAVNMGVVTAARMLQQAVGVDMDGEIGPITLSAAASRPTSQVLGTYAEIRRQRYRGLSTFWRFGKGWLTRVDTSLALANEIARTMSPSPSQPKEPAPMSDTSAPPPFPPANTNATDSKWWGNSITIWGVIVTALSTVLPALGPVFGLNLTAELIRQLGDNVVVVGQALGGLVGTIMAIYGRVRATAQIERRSFTMTM